MSRPSLVRFAWLSLGAAVVTMALKGVAYALTGSVGLLSDALESLVNLAAAAMAVAMLNLAAKPADEEHAYGHTKAEYFSSGVEGALIVITAVSIALAAVNRWLHPHALAAVGLGLSVSTVASVLNLFVAVTLRRAATRFESVVLAADSRHLMTDVWTSVGVIVGVGAVGATGWNWLDPAIAIIVAVNVLWAGVSILRQSALGLLDTALPAPEVALLRTVLERYQLDGVQYHALRTRQSGSRRFVSLHVLVPGYWTVDRGHHLLEQIEADLRGALPNMAVFTHLESISDPASYQDQSLDRN
jgi:cation diffusion facilitator family transporter